MKPLPAGAQEVPRATLEATARILGEHSAAAKALSDADAREATGQEIAFFKAGDMILVGPRPKHSS